MALQLHGISYSPWTQWARWALQHHGISYRFKPYTPYLGEPYLRLLTRGEDGTPTVPLLRGDDVSISDSWDIIVWADEVGDGPSLRTSETEVVEWYERIEACAQSVRVRFTKQLISDERALIEAAAATVPRFAARAAKPVAAAGARFIARKYGFESVDAGGVKAEIRDTFQELADVVQATGFVVGSELSAADLAAAVLTQGVRPHPTRPRMGPETRRVWADPELAAAFPELLEWRDQMFETYG